MFNSSVLHLLRHRLPHSPKLVMEKHLARDIDDLVMAIFPARPLAVVDDRNTAEALGDRVFKALKGRGAVAHITLDAPMADDANAQIIEAKAAGAAALVAVGGGTVNDLCKYVSHKTGRPYLVFPTCASMNGYGSANASIAIDGYKKTIPAHMPEAILCDLSVIAIAPPRLAKSGLGDSLARPTAQADWLLSHLLLGTPYDEAPFELLKDLEPQVFERAGALAKNDPESVALLMKLLLLSGLGMTIAGGSYPASQAEHMLAHAYGMLSPRHSRGGGNPVPLQKAPTLHGEEIGVTTLTMARLQETLLRGKPGFRPNDFDRKKLTALYGEYATGEAEKAFGMKIPSPLVGEGGERSESGEGEFYNKKPPLPNPPPRGGREISDWNSIAEKISRVMIPSQNLQSILKAAHAPRVPEDLGWNAEDYNNVLNTARYLRERFTFLDLILPPAESTRR